ncbi:uncharacterized protein C8Q71DRAFT_855245 [Rhodofomes roseus]|nr:uncharacterized protein C8Q71DRAFT_855245 [Rhodofomes roseus]KAH9839942.1 hypothetical protein C8Q71DRAFT_855245 [Rhodofomes roseus]
MVESFKQSHAFKKSHTTRMYARSNRERAKELSEQGKAHKAKMERLNERASEWIFAKNNEDRAPGDPVDLHNLYVKEAITYTERAVQDARRRGDTKIKLIVGKGRHSLQGVAKLKPAIKRLLQTQGLVVELDPKNAGVLIVNLDGRSTDTDSVLSVDDIVRRFEY